MDIDDRANLSEFDIIARYFSNIGFASPPGNAAVALSVGDDCAILTVPAGQRLALSIDTLVEGRHFPTGADPFAIAERALAVCISDLAAMGAKPLAFTLALTLPAADRVWLDAFSRGLHESANHYLIPLVGGDICAGPLSITIQVHGALPANAGLLRRGAVPGDLIFVTGKLGDAAAALDMLQGRLQADYAQQQYLNSRFYRPDARVVLGQALLDVASAAIDVSDGLLADLGHILSASHVAAKIFSEQLPISSTLAAVAGREQVVDYALRGGDDYELCFTAGAQHRQQLVEYAELFDVPIAEIGEIKPGMGVSCIGDNGDELNTEHRGFQHFQ